MLIFTLIWKSKKTQNTLSFPHCPLSPRCKPAPQKSAAASIAGSSDWVSVVELCATVVGGVGTNPCRRLLWRENGLKMVRKWKIRCVFSYTGSASTVLLSSNHNPVFARWTLHKHSQPTTAHCFLTLPPVGSVYLWRSPVRIYRWLNVCVHRLMQITFHLCEEFWHSFHKCMLHLGAGREPGHLDYIYL